MNVSKFLAKVIGIYLIIISIAMFVNMPQFLTLVNQLINDAPAMFVTGFFTLILGILMVVSHQIWRWNWQGLITLMGWLALLKGVSIIYDPQLIDHMTMLFLQNTSVAYIAAGIYLVLGILLSYFCFKR